MGPTIMTIHIFMDMVTSIILITTMTIITNMVV